MIFRNIDELSPYLGRGCATSWGNFDGVHLGHQALLGRLALRGKELDLPAVAITFDPHPALFFNPDSAPRALTSLEDKLALLASLGLEHTLILPFNNAFARQTPLDFVRNILVGGLRAKALVLGYDVGFGRERAGGVETLRRLGEEKGFTVEETLPLIPPGASGHGPAGSTTAREAIRAGDLRLAAAILGRAHSIHGPVRQGSKRGGEILGFPTANLDPGPLLLPPNGVYACLGKIEEDLYPAAANLGFNPSFSGSRSISLEAHLLDFHGDLYGRTLRLYFLDFLRPERKFGSPEELSKQISIDTLETRRLAELALTDGNFSRLYPL
ncbi:MAG: riboflavin biosynthesis protein RibF [Desulfovibrionaceae bacterium]|nr:riboflavin biosynthesis protein RibF [Desulfovibrionaceae bacterium]